MNLKRVLSALTAAVTAVPCMCIQSAAAISSQSSSEQDSYVYEEPLRYIPDFPQEILDEFGIDWTGEAANVHTESMSFDCDNSHNEFLYEGGYALYSEQLFGKTLCYVFNWHECDSYKACQSMRFPLSDYTEDMKLNLELYADVEIKKSDDLRAGPLLDLNGGSMELFVIEYFSAEAVFSEDEMIGSYTSDGREYDLYKRKEGDGEDAPVRYYAVNKGGLTIENAPDEQRHQTSDINVSAHLASLKEVIKTDITLESFGVLCEGKGGIGNGYFRAALTNDYFQLPEEKLTIDENGEPVVYEHELMKNLDGYRYSLQAFDSGVPEEQDELGRYVFTSHENNSYIIPKPNGTLTAKVSDGLFGTISSGKEFDGKTSVYDKDYHLDYEYTVKAGNKDDAAELDEVSTPAAVATVWTLDPYVQLDYQESTDISPFYGDYYATIMIDGEKYEIRSSYITSSRDREPLGFSYNKGSDYYYIVHIVDEDNSEVKKGSFPITALAEALKDYGVELGDLARVDLSITGLGEYTADILKNEITAEEVSETNPYNSELYADVARSRNGVKIGKYLFNCNSDGYMYGYEKGCFSAGSDSARWSQFEAGIQKKSDGRHRIDPDKELTAKYSIENKYKDNYQLEYELSGSCNGRYQNVHIVENGKNNPIEWNLMNSVAGMYRTPPESEPEFIKNYTAGGHKYDLYKDSVAFSGCFSTSYYDVYVSVRQDQDEGEVIEGVVDFKEHLNVIDETLLDKMSVNSIYLIASSNAESGTVKALKNDISFDTLDVPWNILGDFNDDLRVDSLDLIEARKAIVKMTSEEKKYSPIEMDTNQNGGFDIADIVLLQSYILGKVKSFPSIYG